MSEAPSIPEFSPTEKPEEPHKEVSLGDIEKLWNSMKVSTLLGMKFNLSVSNRAKESGWVDSKKRGFYNLDRSWKEIFVDG